MSRLTPADKEAIKLKHSQGIPGAELARKYGVSESAICYTWKGKEVCRHKVPCPKCGKPMQSASELCHECYLASVKGPRIAPERTRRQGRRPVKESSRIIPSSPKAPSTFVIKVPRALAPVAKERAFCEKSPYPEKAHYTKLNNKGEGKCEYCGKPHGS